MLKLKSKEEIIAGTIIWAKNLFDSALTGGASSALAAFGVGGAQLLGVSVDPLDYKQVGAVFLSGTILEVLKYLKQKPTPDIDEDDSGTNNKN